MKKASLLILGILFLLGTSVSAQFFSFGIKGGVNYSKLKFDDLNNINGTGLNYNIMEDESFQNFHFGIMTRIKVMNVYLQPELYFNTSGGKVLIEEVQTSGMTTEYVRSVKYSKVDLPVMLGFKIGPLRLNAGPVASVVLSENNEIEEIIPDLESLSKSATIGYQAGLGIDILKFLTLDYRYEGGLSKWGDKLSLGGTDYAFDSRANMHLLSLGILF